MRVFTLVLALLLGGCGADPPNPLEPALQRAEQELEQLRPLKEQLVVAQTQTGKLEQQVDDLSRRLAETQNISEDKDTTVSTATILLAGFSSLVFVAIALLAKEVIGRRGFRLRL